MKNYILMLLQVNRTFLTETQYFLNLSFSEDCKCFASKTLKYKWYNFAFFFALKGKQAQVTLS